MIEIHADRVENLPAVSTRLAFQLIDYCLEPIRPLFFCFTDTLDMHILVGRVISDLVIACILPAFLRIFIRHILLENIDSLGIF